MIYNQLGGYIHSCMHSSHSLSTHRFEPWHTPTSKHKASYSLASVELGNLPASFFLQYLPEVAISSKGKIPPVSLLPSLIYPMARSYPYWTPITLLCLLPCTQERADRLYLSIPVLSCTILFSLNSVTEMVLQSTISDHQLLGLRFEVA